MGGKKKEQNKTTPKREKDKKESKKTENTAPNKTKKVTDAGKESKLIQKQKDKLKSPLDAQPVQLISLSRDALWLAIIHLLIIVRNHFFPVQMYDIYTEKSIYGFSIYVLVMRCLFTKLHVPEDETWISDKYSNKKTKQNEQWLKMYVRCAFFNCVRQAFPTLFMAYFFGEGDFQLMKILKEQIFQFNIIVVVTMVFHLIPKKKFLYSKKLLFWLQAEFFAFHPFFHITVLNKINSVMKGDLVMYAVVFYFVIHTRLIPLYLEDLIFGDLNTFDITTIPQNYIGHPQTSAAVLLSLQYLGKWPLQFDWWPQYEHCKIAPINLILKEQCRPRMYGYKEMLDYRNEKHIVFFDIANLAFVVWIYIAALRSLRKLRAKDDQAAALERSKVTPEDNKKVKQD